MLIDFDELFRKYAIKTDGIVHLGANEGQEAEAYARQGINKVMWVEALPEVFHLLCAKVPNHHIKLNACLSDVDGQTVDFHVASNDGQSSSLLKPTLHLQKHPTVKFPRKVTLVTSRFDVLMDQMDEKDFFAFQYDFFLNVDLQGAEMLALRGMGDYLSRFKYVYIEVNREELYKGCPMVQEIDNYLAQFGLVGQETKWTGSGWGDKFYMR